jgi:hypothetical protein
MQSIGTLARTVLADLRERMDKDRGADEGSPASDARGGEVARFVKGTAAEASRYHRHGGKRGRRPAVGRSEL